MALYKTLVAKQGEVTIHKAATAIFRIDCTYLCDSKIYENW